MAELVEKRAQEHSAEAEAAEEFFTVSDVPEPEETPTIDKDEKESFLVPEAELMMPVVPDSPESVKPEDKTPLPPPPPEAEVETVSGIPQLSENEKKALQELKQLLQEALNNHEFGIASSSFPPKSDKKQQEVAEKEDTATEKDSIPETTAKTLLEDDGAKTLEAIEETIVACVHPCNPSQENAPQEPTAAPKKAPEQVRIWGVNLLEDSRSDVVLLKFLQARDFMVKEAFTMIKNTIKWRKEFGIDELVDEDLGSNELERVVFMHGYSREGHPVCYNVYGEFQNKDLYQRMFSDEEKRRKFLRLRIQFLEKSIRKLDFRPGGVSTIVHVNDLRNSPGPNRWELRQATNQALHFLQDNYPEFVAKQIFINVPWWYLALSKMISPFMTQRTKNKFVVAGPSKSTETLFKYISAEQIPTLYGGLSKDGDFGVADCVTEIIVNPSAKHIVEFPVAQGCTVSWEARVVGWEVRYGAEFVPSAEEGYTIIVQKMRSIGASEEQVICSSYKVGDPGDLLLTIHNPTSKKKKLLYRIKTKLSN